MDVPLKKCPECEETKTYDDFHKNRLRRDGLERTCRECRGKKNRGKVYDPLVSRERNLKAHYGITTAQYWAMFHAQGGVCASCGKEETIFDTRINAISHLAIDHCHKTKKVRALLCTRCNTALGSLEEDPERIERLLQYARKIKQTEEIKDGRS